MRKVTSTLFFAASMFSATSAFAQIESFGQKGTVAFSADRLFSFFKASYTHENANGDDTCGEDNQPDCDATGIGFGMNAGAGVFGFPYNYPRFAFDYFIIDNLNIGGSLAYASLDTDNGGVEAFLFSPRVGYFIGISGAFGFWPRGGFTYHSVDPDGGGNDNSGFGLTLEAMFAVAPVEHFAFLFGPTADIDFAGSTEAACADDDDCKWRQRSFGVQVGLMGWL
jgi:hypothetical protein